jgi:hypothetical protein
VVWEEWGIEVGKEGGERWMIGREIHTYIHKWGESVFKT